jgi:hypothetical protein
MLQCGQDLRGPGQGPLSIAFEAVNEPSVSLKKQGIYLTS